MVTIIIYISFVVWGLLSLLWISSQNQKWYYLIPSIFTTIGIFGTFWGIYKGLQGFDVTNIDKSIPLLLEGMKTAFSTSLWGIGLSVFSKFIINAISKEVKQKDELALFSEMASTLKAIQQNTNNTEELGLLLKEVSALKNESQFLNQVVENIENTQINVFEKLTEFLPVIDSHITEQTTSFVKQLSELRKEQNIRHESLNKTIDSFADLLKKNNTEALVEVMKESTQQFNSQMSVLIEKLVQENFKELNNSVQTLNSWQQENKEMIGSLTNQFKSVEESYLVTTNQLKGFTDEVDKQLKLVDSLVKHTKSLTKEDSQLANLIKELKNVISDDKKFTEITNKLLETSTILKENTNTFEKTTKKLNDWIRDEKTIKDSFTLLLSELQKIGDIKDINKEFWKNTKMQMEEGVSIISNASNQLKNDLDNISQEFVEELSSVLKSLDELIQRLVKKNS